MIEARTIEQDALGSVEVTRSPDGLTTVLTVGDTAVRSSVTPDGRIAVEVRQGAQTVWRYEMGPLGLVDHNARERSRSEAPLARGMVALPAQAAEAAAPQARRKPGRPRQYPPSPIRSNQPTLEELAARASAGGSG